MPGMPELGTHVQVCLSRNACPWHTRLQYSCPWYAASPPIGGTQSALHPIHTLRGNLFLCFFLLLYFFFFETLGPCLSVLVPKLKCRGAFRSVGCVFIYMKTNTWLTRAELRSFVFVVNDGMCDWKVKRTSFLVRVNILAKIDYTPHRSNEECGRCCEPFGGDQR